MKDLKRQDNSLSRGSEQTSTKGWEGSPPPLKDCSAVEGSVDIVRWAGVYFRQANMNIHVGMLESKLPLSSIKWAPCQLFGISN
jgi:hypothetical protein